MSPVIAMILDAVVPVLVGKLGALIPAGPQNVDKYAWVEGALNEAISAISAKFNAPSWAVALEGEAEIYLKTLIEKELAKIDPPAPTPAA